jgi:hypothetical protein
MSYNKHLPVEWQLRKAVKMTHSGIIHLETLSGGLPPFVGNSTSTWVMPKGVIK